MRVRAHPHLVLLAACAAVGAPLAAQTNPRFQPTPIAWQAGPLALRGPARPGGYVSAIGRMASTSSTITTAGSETGAKIRCRTVKTECT